MVFGLGKGKGHPRGERKGRPSRETVDDGRYDRHDDRHDRQYDDRHDERYEDARDERYDDRYDEGYGDRQDEQYDDRYDERYDERRDSHDDGAKDDGRSEEAGNQGGDTDNPDDDDSWLQQWSSWKPQEDEGEDEGLEQVELEDDGTADRPRRRQNLPANPEALRMAEAFVDRFRNGGTVGIKTKTSRIVSMQAVSEADIPTIKRRLRRSNIPANLFMVICAGVIVYFSYVLGSYFMSLAQNDVQMDTITAQYTKPIAQTAPGVETVQVNETDMPPIVDFEGLKGVNGEVSSWLRVPGTTIDYPVMTTAEKEKYLRKDIDENYSVPGMLFTDWENTEETLSEEYHIVIYGHHLPWPAMFHDMSLYLEEPGFVESHRKMYFETPDQTYVLSVIGIHKALPEESQARRTMSTFLDYEEFQDFLDERLAANTAYDSHDYDRKTLSKLFTFITCTDSGTRRCIVNARVVEQYPTSYVPLVRAKMQGLIKADGSIDEDKQAQQEGQQEQQAQQEGQQEGDEAAGGE